MNSESPRPNTIHPADAQAATSPEQLQEAFRAFNEISLQLAASYRDLEARVAQLNEELAAARSERLLQLAEKERLANRLTRLLEALPGGVVVLDGNGAVQECNPVAADLLGEPLLGVAWREVARRAFAPRRGDSREVTLRDGRHVSISTRSLGEEPGQILLLNDVTETRTLQEMVNRHKRLSAMGEMAAKLAHQIRTPLASALLYVSHVTRTDLEAEDRSRFAQKILSRLRHLEAMVNDMLAFARGSAVSDETFPVRMLADDLEVALEPQLQSCAGHLTIENRVPDAMLTGNRQALLGALLNLATNALQACGEGARLRLLIARGLGDVVELRLSDNGPGIPEEIRDRIFEPFFTTRPDGTGLGLAVVQAVAESHRGEVRVQSRAGEGTTFILRLPLGERQDALPSGVAAAEAIEAYRNAENREQEAELT